MRESMTLRRVFLPAAAGALLLSSMPGFTAVEPAPLPEPTGWVVGELRPFAFGPVAGAASPSLDRLHRLGWLECAGQPLAARAFPELRAVIGETWGGGGGTFLVPDLRGLFLRGWQTKRDEETYEQLMGGDLVKGREDATPARLRPERADVTYFIYVGKDVSALASAPQALRARGAGGKKEN